MNCNPSAATQPNRRILLVDDSRAIHEDFRKILGETADATSDLDNAEAALLGESAIESAARLCRRRIGSQQFNRIRA